MGVYGTLMTMLTAAPTMQGVSVFFGEENISSRPMLPYICIVPTGGPYDEPGYAKDLNPGIEAIWAVKSTIDIYLWHAALDSVGQPSSDLAAHADAISDLRARVLQAFQNQRPYGLYFKPQSERWSLMEGANKRYGRCLVLSMMAEIPIPDVNPIDATVQTLTLSATITT